VKTNRILTFLVLPVIFAAVGLTWFYRSGRWESYRFASETKYRFRPDTSFDGTPKEISALEDRVKAHPTEVMDLNELAFGYVRKAQITGDVTWYDKAETVARKSLSLLSSPNPAKLVLAQVCEARHEFDEAIQWARQSMNDRPSSSPLQVIVTSYLAQGNYVEANRNADQLVQQKPGADTLLTRGLVRAAQGRENEADFDFHRAVQLEDYGDPHGAARLRALWARMLTSKGEFAKAQVLLKQSLQIVPNNHLALALYGDLEMARGNYDLAEKYLMDAFSRSKQLRYLVHAARAKLRGSDRHGAEEIWTQAEIIARKDLERNSYGHRLDLAQILVDRGKTSDLVEAIVLQGQELRFRRNPETLFYYAKALAGLKRWTEARDVMGELLSTGAKDAEFYDLEGKIQMALGYLPTSAFYFHLAQNRNSDLPSPKAELDKLHKLPRVVQGRIEP
jgi:tetratricopeptide (TPR) repeat protein